MMLMRTRIDLSLMELETARAAASTSSPLGADPSLSVRMSPLSPASPVAGDVLRLGADSSPFAADTSARTATRATAAEKRSRPRAGLHRERCPGISRKVPERGALAQGGDLA